MNVLYGSLLRLDVTGNQIWEQNQPGVAGRAEEGDQFGRALAAGDFNGDGFVDLAIGVDSEDVGQISAAGAVNVLYGSAARLDGRRQPDLGPGGLAQLAHLRRTWDRFRPGLSNLEEAAR